MKKLLLILLFYFIPQLIISQKQDLDIIKPINLTAGKADSILVSDLFFAEEYDVRFKKNKLLDVSYNKKTGMIKFYPDLTFSGTTLLDFQLSNSTYSIPVRSQINQKFKFNYKPEKKYKSLTLFGSFNGWDRGNLPMKDEDGDGEFTAEVALEPGRYEYKFFGDGEEIVDPLNPDRKPNGMGDFNSIFNVADLNVGTHFLHIADKKISKQKSLFSFLYENEKDGSSIKKENVIVLLNNKRHPFRISQKNKIEVAVSRNENKGQNTLRVIVSKRGRSSNIQTVKLHDGIPAGNDNFSWHDAIIYSLMIDRFNDGDKSINKPIIHDSLHIKANYMGGDLQGIINKLNEGYFTNLGINTLWISPVNDNPDKAYKEAPAPHRWYSGYHGYWPISSNIVEDQFGNMNKLRELVSLAQSKGIKILLDFVANHVHELHPIVKQKPDWFGNLNLPDGRMNLRLWDEQRLTTWFEPYLPKFNFVSSKEVIDFMADNAIWWLRTTGADGFRQDAVKHISNNFWRTLTRKIKKEIEIPEKRHVYQIGETFGSYELISSYVNNGQLSAQFNFNVYDVALPTILDPQMSFKSLDAEIKKSFLVYGENNLMGNVMDSHDKNRFMSFADGDLELSQWSAIEEGWNNPPRVDNPSSYEKAKLYYAYMHAIPGLPVIYYGSEFGMTGASDPDNRRMMRFDNELNENESNMLSQVSNIVNIRKNNSALRYGDFLTLHADQNLYAFIRSDLNQRILVVLNKNEKEQNVNIGLPGVYKVNNAIDLITNDVITIANNKFSLSIPGYGYKYYNLK
ncbi:MAG: alpha-glucosidase C-terminal domain-containing protein [Melioribacteraceae bacterium]|nr:alpha-glucosidase C-terminal domain-containing protein [Melioribacteraceae bacterium]